MKLKFRAEPKDLATFLIFCVVLLYLVCIAVLNLSSFAENSTFHGLNPIPAFSSKYILATMIGFIVILIAILMSVSSYFFERDKGIGISTESKKEKGYSRWAKDSEMKKQLKNITPFDEETKHAGIVLINNGKEMWVDDGEYHSLIIGSTGSGKTQITVLPLVKNLSKKGESMIITDPKGELYEKTSNMLREKGYNVVLLNFRDPQRGNSWNPLGLPYQLHKSGNRDKATELLDDLAMNILYDEKAQNQDPFWEKTSADYFAGLALGLFDDASEEEINLNSINLMTTVGEEKCGPSTYVKEYFNTKDPASPAYINASSTLMSPNETKGSILAVFKQKIKLFSSRENLSEMLSHSDFDMKDIGKKKTAVFIVIQDEKKTYHSLVTIFIKQCYETLIDVAQECGGKLPFRTNFILDEFANMPPLKDVTTMVTAARSRHIRFNFIIQNFAQLYQVYGKENGETIKGNCGNIIYLISSEIAALEEISKMSGEVKSKEKEKTASTPLITVSDLQRLKEGETVILRTRMMPFKTKLMFDWKMDWGKNYPNADYPTRERREIKLFDIKKFVNEQREKKINELMGNFSVSNDVEKTPPLFNSNREHTPRPNAGGINVDELVKKIDARIAELEEEERKEKAQQEKKNDILTNKKDKKENDIISDIKLPSFDIINDSIEEKTNNEIEEKSNNEIEENKNDSIIAEFAFKPIDEIKDIPFEPIADADDNFIKVPVESKKEEYITDDQFFDDFFADDEE